MEWGHVHCWFSSCGAGGTLSVLHGIVLASASHLDTFFTFEAALLCDVDWLFDSMENEKMGFFCKCHTY